MDPSYQRACFAAGPAPALAVWRGDRHRAVARGSMLVLHGLGASKETQLPELRFVADRGLMAVAVDAAGHGERRLEDFDERFRGDGARAGYVALVEQTASEMAGVRTALIEQGWAQPDRMSATGISMGGAILFGAMARGCRFCAAMFLVATPEWPGSPQSPHLAPSRFPPTPLMIQSAGRDDIIDNGPCRDFIRAIEPTYADPSHLRYIEFPDEGHMMSEPVWWTAWEAIHAWVQRHTPAHC